MDRFSAWPNKFKHFAVVMNCCYARIVHFETFWLKRNLGLTWLVAANKSWWNKDKDKKKKYTYVYIINFKRKITLSKNLFLGIDKIVIKQIKVYFSTIIKWQLKILAYDVVLIKKFILIMIKVLYLNFH